MASQVVLVAGRRITASGLGATRSCLDSAQGITRILARTGMRLIGSELSTIGSPGAWTAENRGPSKTRPNKGALIPAGKALHGVAPAGQREGPWKHSPGGIDFTAPGFAMTVADDRRRCRTFAILFFDQPRTRLARSVRLTVEQLGIAARTDYIVNGRNDCMLFLTAAKPNGEEGRPSVLGLETVARLGILSRG